MKSMRDIWAAYQQAEGYLKGKRLAAKSMTSQARWDFLRRINDQAYFMVLFACFEGRVTDLCERLVKSRRSAPSWRHRRLWDTIDVSKLQFMRRAALLIEKRSSSYGRINDLYKVRCLIAHGSPAKVGAIQLAPEYLEICRLWRALRA